MTGESYGAAIRAAAAKLATAGISDPVRDARKLMETASGLGPAALSARSTDPVPESTGAVFEAFVDRRMKRQPVSQITGEREFYGRSFRVTPDVLDPRPETERLVELALAGPFTRVLDLGTGSGAILVTLLAERPWAKGVGTDISGAALMVAGDNAVRHGVASRIVLSPSDWWADVGGRYDLVVSNPPYIASAEMDGLAPEVRDWEPRGALTDGADGLSAYRAIADGIVRHLLPGGRILVEIGPSQAGEVAGIFLAKGLTDIAIDRDLDGRDRVVSARMPAN